MVENKNVIKSALDLIIKIREEEEVTIQFIKQDNTVRTMKCTLNFDKIPVKQRPKNFDLTKMLKLIQKSGVIHVYDLVKQDWRSIPFKTSQFLVTADGTRYDIE